MMYLGVLAFKEYEVKIRTEVRRILRRERESYIAKY
jgi:hypothetical protein